MRKWVQLLWLGKDYRVLRKDGNMIVIVGGSDLRNMLSTERNSKMRLLVCCTSHLYSFLISFPIYQNRKHKFY